MALTILTIGVDLSLHVVMLLCLHPLVILQVLTLSGENEVAFLAADAEAYRKDLPQADIHLRDTGHFALETHAESIGALMREFLSRQLGNQ